MLPLAILAVLLAFACAALVLFVRTAARQKEVFVEGLPEVPDAHWLLGHFKVFAKVLNSGEFGSAQRTLCYDYANSDALCSFWVMGKRWVSVTDPETVRMVLTMAHNRNSSALQQRHGEGLFGKRNILSMRGREWRYWRSTIHRAFTPAALKAMQARMVGVAIKLVESVGKRINDDNQGSLMDAEELMKMVTLDTFGMTALGIDFRSCHTLTASPVAEAFDFLSSELLRRLKSFYVPTSHFYSLPTETNRRHRRERALIRNVLDEAVKSRRQQAKETSEEAGEEDLLAHLFKAVDGATKNDEVSNETFSDMLMGLLFAGYETTSITLTYALYCLAKNPDAEARAIEEIHAVLGPASSDAIQQMKSLDPNHLPYCQAIIMETLRLYPPAIHTFRTLEQPLKISDFTIPPGTNLFIPFWAIQRDENVFPRPLEFLPERWFCREAEEGSGGSAWRDRQSGEMSDESDIPPGNRNAFLAFSGGARSCVGRKFAMQEAVIILATCMRSLKFEVDDDYVVEPFRSGIIQTPRGGMPTKISHRS